MFSIFSVGYRMNIMGKINKNINYRDPQTPVLNHLPFSMKKVTLILTISFNKNRNIKIGKSKKGKKEQFIFWFKNLVCTLLIQNASFGVDDWCKFFRIIKTT